MNRRFLLVLTLLCLIFFGCGGGSTGTDGGIKIKVKGIVTSSKGDELPDLKVIVEETGENSFTNSKGEFELDSKLPDSKLTLILSNEERSVIIDSLQSLNNGDEIDLKISINEEDFSVSIQSIRINSIDETPISESTVTPFPTPTAGVITQKDLIEGVAISNNNFPLNTVKISIPNSKASDISDVNGEFKILGFLSRTDPRLVVLYRGAEKILKLPKLPRSAVHISIVLVVNVTTTSTPGQVDTYSLNIKIGPVEFKKRREK